eukprot:TRINITY_DN75145_c0_g1_i1.p1 TRINITY_DN75145_c0_g1~~TRINITY_DN75145_c0_g1_i1.p1  ORF type:complete len:162 (-),score=48.18 TRINITY_DN75145_c0_g1_i1:90-575(-)
MPRLGGAGAHWSPAHLLTSLQGGVPHWFSSFFDRVHSGTIELTEDLVKVDGSSSMSCLARACGGDTDMSESLMDVRSAIKHAKKVAEGEVFTVGQGEGQEHTTATYSQSAANAVKKLEEAEARIENWETTETPDATDPEAGEKESEAAANDKLEHDANKLG